MQTEIRCLGKCAGFYEVHGCDVKKLRATDRQLKQKILKDNILDAFKGAWCDYIDFWCRWLKRRLLGKMDEAMQYFWKQYLCDHLQREKYERCGILCYHTILLKRLH